jgi:hypothetical protein
MNSNNETWGFFVDIEKIKYQPNIDFESLEIKKINEIDKIIFNIIYILIKITLNIIFFIGITYIVFYII